MAKLPYYFFWVNDYNSDPLVLAMTDDQDLAYRRLIDKSWDLGPLPNDPVKLAALVRFDKDRLNRFKAAWVYPLTECWPETPEGLVNPRLEKERDRAMRRVEQARDAGLRSGRSRIKGGPKKPKAKPSKKDERSLNDRSTDVERPLNSSDYDSGRIKRSTNNHIDLSNKGDGTGQRSADRTAPKAVTGRVKWVIETGKDKKKVQRLEASEKFKAEFLSCWQELFSIDEIKEQIEKATRWLVPRPERRGSRSRLDMYLHGWMEKALKDKANKAEFEEETSRMAPPEPEQKWCLKCRGTLPEHMLWCSDGIKGEKDGAK